jgi:CDP-diacylglycerol--glycerol-3-phosphate 3-phosphatidyltransferase
MKYMIKIVRSLMTSLAVILDRLTKGRLRPNHITVLSLLGHVIFFCLLVSPVFDNPSPRLAAVVLIVFGLMDALDGALARVQKTSSLQGMYADAVSDRLKEVIVFSALALFILDHPSYNSHDAWLAVAAVGFSALVSYTKAKGEMAVSTLNKKINPQELNRLFGDGLARYEVRMTLVIIGLVFPVLPQILWIIIVLTAGTALYRFVRIYRYLKRAEHGAH